MARGCEESVPCWYYEKAGRVREAGGGSSSHIVGCSCFDVIGGGGGEAVYDGDRRRGDRREEDVVDR